MQVQSSCVGLHEISPAQPLPPAFTLCPSPVARRLKKIIIITNEVQVWELNTYSPGGFWPQSQLVLNANYVYYSITYPSPSPKWAPPAAWMTTPPSTSCSCHLGRKSRSAWTPHPPTLACLPVQSIWTQRSIQPGGLGPMHCLIDSSKSHT